MLIYFSGKKLKTISFFSLSPKQSFNDVYYIVYMNCIIIAEGN